jgi:predicted GTPase
MQGKARVNFAHAVLLLVDGEAIAARIARAAADGHRALDRREVNLATFVLEEGRLLVIAANKLDLLSQQQRYAVMEALRAQVHSLLPPLLSLLCMPPCHLLSSAGSQNVSADG